MIKRYLIKKIEEENKNNNNLQEDHLFNELVRKAMYSLERDEVDEILGKKSKPKKGLEINLNKEDNEVNGGDVGTSFNSVNNMMSSMYYAVTANIR